MWQPPSDENQEFDWSKAENFENLSFGDEKKKRKVPVVRGRKERRNTSNFVNTVTKKKRSASPSPSGSTRVNKNLTDMYVYSENPKFPISVDYLNYDNPQYVSKGMMVGTISSMTLPELKQITAYMMEKSMLPHPENFARFEELKEINGGKEILLYEIFNQGDDVVSDFYQLGGRVKSKNQKDKVKNIVDGQNGFSTTDIEHQGTEFGYSRQSLSPLENTITGEHYVPIPNDPLNLLRSNIGQPYDDPHVYLVKPARSIRGYYDAPSDRMVDLCSQEMTRWFDKTVMESDKLPELEKYQEDRQMLGQLRRQMCPASPEPWVQRARSGYSEFDSPEILPQESYDELKNLGWPDDKIQLMYGEGSWPPGTLQAQN